MGITSFLIGLLILGYAVRVFVLFKQDEPTEDQLIEEQLNDLLLKFLREKDR